MPTMAPGTEALFIPRRIASSSAASRLSARLCPNKGAAINVAKRIVVTGIDIFMAEFCQCQSRLASDKFETRKRTRALTPEAIPDSIVVGIHASRAAYDMGES